ncbi:MAG: CDP-glycerol glycerophosphotransferase family protein [Clostridia bacterium]
MKIVKKILKWVYKEIKLIFAKIFYLDIFKIQNNKIVFDNFLGKGYGCNPKYIAEEIIKEQLDYELVWLVKDIKSEMPQQIRKVKYGSIRALYELATAKVWIDNVRNYKGIDKKEQQFYIQTWHGSIGLKKVEKAVEDKLDPQYILQAKNDGKITNLMITNNMSQYEEFKQTYWYNGEVQCCGLPREDVLYKNNKNITEKVYKYFNIESNRKIVLYAPTFRNESNGNVYMSQYEECCKALNKKFSSDYIMLVKMHPNVIMDSSFVKYNKNIKNATMYPDIQELISVADVVITDYSSVAFEAGIVNKKVFLIAKDFEEYIKKERQFKFDLNDIPFKIAKTESELIENINKFSYDEYKQRLKVFYDKIGFKYNDNAAEYIVKRIKNEIESGDEKGENRKDKKSN